MTPSEIDAIADEMTVIAKENFEEHHMLTPVGIIILPNGRRVPTALLWNDAESKRRAMRQLRATSEALDAEAVIFISDAYFSRPKKGEELYLLPSHDPNRMEALIVATYHGERRRATMHPYTRVGSEIVWETPVEPSGEHPHECEGAEEHFLWDQDKPYDGPELL